MKHPSKRVVTELGCKKLNLSRSALIWIQGNNLKIDAAVSSNLDIT